MPRSETDAIEITPSQFIIENRGILGGTYQFTQKIGQGKETS